MQRNLGISRDTVGGFACMSEVENKIELRKDIKQSREQGYLYSLVK